MCILILHDIRSEQNVGSLFRSADAAGIKAVYLSGITPAPIDRFGRSVAGIAKTALGAQDNIAWRIIDDIDKTIRDLTERGYTIIAIEQSPTSVDYKTVTFEKPAVFILGNEVTGLPQSVLDECDIVAEIAMRGKKESLNVSVAGGIALFRMLDI